MDTPEAVASEPQAIPLSQLPLVDHSTGEYGGLDSAVLEYRHREYEARTHDEQVKRQAELAAEFERGRAQGAAEATQRARQEGLDLLRTFPSLVAMAATAANDAAQAAVADAGRDMVAAALEIAQWVLSDAIEADPARLLAVAERALSEAGGVHGAIVYVSGDLHDAAQTWAGTLGIDSPQIVLDSALGTASVRIVAATGGRADVNLPALIARASEALGVTAHAPSEQA